MTAYLSHPDNELLRMMKAGDEAAFTALYRRRQSAVYRFAMQMSGSPSLAEDVTQEVFLALMNDTGNFDSTRGSLSAYLFGIARNQVLRRFEKERFFVPILDETPDGDELPSDLLVDPKNPLDDLTSSMMVDRVRQAVASLPTHYREVVALCDLNELSYVEASEALGCAVGTVRSRLHRARSILIEKLRGEELAEEAEPGMDTLRCFA